MTQVSNIDVATYNKGSMMVSLDNGDYLHMNLTPDEKEQFLSLGNRIFEARQQALAVEVAKPMPALIDLTPAPHTPVDDDVPFQGDTK